MKRMLDQGKTGTQNQASRLSGTGSPQILLAAAPGLDAAAIGAFLKTAGCFEGCENQRAPSMDGATLLRSFEPDGALERAKAALAAQPDSTLLLIYPAPIPTIAGAIADDVTPEQALEDWLSRAEEILGIFRQARRRIILVEHSAALANPADLIEELNQRLDLALTRPESAGSSESAESSPASNADPVHLLIADRACHHSPRARRIAAELEVSALPLTAAGGASKIDLSSSFQTYREKSTIPPAQVNGLKEENRRLLAQLNQTQEELESVFLKGREREKELNAAQEETARQKAEIQQSQTDNAKLRQENEDLKEENELLLHQLHHVQEELERYFLEHSASKSKFDEQEKQKIALTNEVQRLTDTEKALRSSLSWKITAPIRLLLRPFMGK